MGRGLRHAAAVLAMICLTTGFTGLSGLIWTGAQQQRVYDDLIRQTKRESVLLSRTKNGGENGSVQRTRVSVAELQERRLEQAQTKQMVIDFPDTTAAWIVTVTYTGLEIGHSRSFRRVLPTPIPKCT